MVEPSARPNGLLLEPAAVVAAAPVPVPVPDEAHDASAPPSGSRAAAAIEPRMKVRRSNVERGVLPVSCGVIARYCLSGVVIGARDGMRDAGFSDGISSVWG